MKVDRPRARSSEAPTRENRSGSTRPISARRRRHEQPRSAPSPRSARSAADMWIYRPCSARSPASWRRGRRRRRMSAQSFATKLSALGGQRAPPRPDGAPLRLSKRPAPRRIAGRDTSRARPRGMHWPAPDPSAASRAPPPARRYGKGRARPERRGDRLSNRIRFSISSASPAGVERCGVSSSDELDGVEPQGADSAVVCRWMNRSDRGRESIRLAMGRRYVSMK